MPDQPLIAIVDDDEILLQLAENALTCSGIKTACFSSAPAFLAALDGLHNLRLIVSDMEMPHMTGYELQCRLEEMGIGIPVVFLSATVDVALASAMISHGAIDVLCKPLDVPALLALVNSVITAKAA
jgi:FixJ family two-component response regulator